MNLRLLAPPLVAATLLSTLGCSKQDDATPVNTGSYKLDGVLRNCKAETYSDLATSNGYTYKRLTVYLTTTPQPASGAEALKVIFYKVASQADTSYRCSDVHLYTKGDLVFPACSFVTYPSSQPVITSAHNASISGTFSATSITYPSTYASVSEGVFTNVRY